MKLLSKASWIHSSSVFWVFVGKWILFYHSMAPEQCFYEHKKKDVNNTWLIDRSPSQSLEEIICWNLSGSFDNSCT